MTLIKINKWSFTSGPPAIFSKYLHSSVVLESIQTGESLMEKHPTSCWCKNLSESRFRRVSWAPFFQYTVPCCWADPDKAATLPKSAPQILNLSNNKSRALTHIRGGAVTKGLPARFTIPPWVLKIEKNYQVHYFVVYYI